MSARHRLRRLFAGDPERLTPAPSWQPAGAGRVLDVLRRLEHHARTFPAPSEVDDAVVRRAALDLRLPTR